MRKFALDRLILRPTRQTVFSYSRKRMTVPYLGGELEIWHQCHGCQSASDAELFVLKFGGTSSRAERSGSHPVDFWPGLPTVTWALNPPGYGGSTGDASLRSLGHAARCAFDAIHREANGRPVLVSGSSLGAVISLYVSARCPIDGLIVRNPPAIREVILRRYGWWNLGAHWMGSGVPRDLCSLRNAATSSMPALFVTSGKDRVVPPDCQHLVFYQYGGPKRQVHFDRAGHDSPLTPRQRTTLQPLADWLLGSISPGACKETAANHDTIVSCCF